MIEMRAFKGAALVALLALVGCGDADTPYGSEDAVSAYRGEISALIAEINTVETIMRELAVGSTGQATGENLTAACLQLEARLAAVLVELDAIAPPRKLSEPHADMRAAVELRREACAKIAFGWLIEQEQSFAQAALVYQEAEALLARANERLAAAAEVLEKVDVALGVKREGNPTG